MIFLENPRRKLVKTNKEVLGDSTEKYGNNLWRNPQENFERNLLKAHGWIFEKFVEKLLGIFLVSSFKEFLEIISMNWPKLNIFLSENFNLHLSLIYTGLRQYHR